MAVGIEKINLYAGSLFLDVEDLAKARNKDSNYIKESLGLHKKALNVDYEDVITLAVNAAKPIITDQDREDIELCIFATESGLDYCKSNSTYVCRYLGLKSSVRNFEIKHACYATTCALQMAISWVASGVAPGKKALIISSDVTYELAGRPSEEVPAVGSVAMLISDTPTIVAFELGKNGYHTFECNDYARPTRTRDILNGEESVYAYLECVDGAWEHYKQNAGEPITDEHFQRMLFHTPMVGLVRIAHSNLLKTERPGIKKKEIKADFEIRVGNSFLMNEEIGHTYSSSIYMCLLSLLIKDQNLQANDRIGMFSYGSGCCAEFFSVIVLPGAQEYVRRLGVKDYLASRYRLSVDQYDELLESQFSRTNDHTFDADLTFPDGWYDKFYKGKGHLILKGTTDFVREYEWS
ncbi:hydroxymethylglutaryl-CoA synthase family protein [Candidatus Latescibacterota bacterium]